MWDEVLSGHTDAGSAGDIIVDSIDALVSTGGGLDTLATTFQTQLIDLVWDEVLATHTTNCSVGEVLLDSLDANASL